MWVMCVRVGDFSILEKLGESPQVSFPRGFVYSSQIKGFFFFTWKGLILFGFNNNVVRVGTFSIVWKSDDSSHALLPLKNSFRPKP